MQPLIKQVFMFFFTIKIDNISFLKENLLQYFQKFHICSHITNWSVNLILLICIKYLECSLHYPCVVLNKWKSYLSFFRFLFFYKSFKCGFKILYPFCLRRSVLIFHHFYISIFLSVNIKEVTFILITIIK